jgi:hypothetical protein
MGRWGSSQPEQTMAILNQNDSSNSNYLTDSSSQGNSNIIINSDSDNFSSPPTHTEITVDTVSPPIANTATMQPNTSRQIQTQLATESLESDWCTWGDSMMSSLDSNSSCRVVLQNTNGIQNKTSLLGHRANELGINILGLVETNVDWQCRIPSKYKSKTAITKILRQFWKQTCMAFSSSDHRPKFFFQPGGTLTLAGNPWSGRASADTDPSGMGRWSSISIKGRDRTNVTIFSVYRVCAGQIKTAGPGTCFAQLWHLADMKNIQPNKPRQQVLDDLEEAIQKC